MSPLLQDCVNVAALNSSRHSPCPLLTLFLRLNYPSASHRKDSSNASISSIAIMTIIININIST